MKTKTSLCSLCFLLLISCPLFAQLPQPVPADDTRAYFEVLRSRFDADKITTINEVLKLTPAEEEKFWPIYRAYEQELAAIADRKLQLFREFLSYHKTGTLTDERARVLAQNWLKNVQQRTDLWKKYHHKISNAVSPTRAAQFLQLENQIALFIDLSIASEMPAIGSKPKP